jgi:hypothetical protein
MWSTGVEAGRMNPQTGFIAMVVIALWLPTIALIAMFKFRKLQLEERLAAIARGADIAFDPEETAQRTRRSGIVFVAAGLGLSAADVIIALAAWNPAVLVGQAVAVVPIAIGIGLLFDYRINRREITARRGEMR